MKLALGVEPVEDDAVDGDGDDTDDDLDQCAHKGPILGGSATLHPRQGNVPGSPVVGRPSHN